MQALKKSILKVLAYFDIFNYPVTYEEIKSFLDQPFTELELQAALLWLANNGLLYRINGFYSLKPDNALVERRIKGNRQAEKQLARATKIARFLSRFPYMRGIAVSGSLSKHFAYKGSDIDFFIITAPNRLWTARMFFVCLLCIARVIGLKKWFCLNYFIDTKALDIPEQNTYTAIEIATLIPKQGSDVFADFYKQNSWVRRYLPNYNENLTGAPAFIKGWLQYITEKLLDNKTGDRIENYLCNFYRARWKKMLGEKRYAKNGFQFGSYIAGKHVCKPMPQYFQDKIMKALAEKMAAIEKATSLPQQMAV